MYVPVVNLSIKNDKKLLEQLRTGFKRTINGINLGQKWYTISMIKITQFEGTEDDTTVTFETKVIKPNLCDYSDAYILVTGSIAVTGGDGNTRVALKNCAPFTKCVTHINNEHVDGANNLDIIMPMYNLIEYSDKYSNTSGHLKEMNHLY